MNKVCLLRYLPRSFGRQYLWQCKLLADLDDHILLQSIDFEQFLPVNVIGQGDGDDRVAACNGDSVAARLAIVLAVTCLQSMCSLLMSRQPMN